MFMPGDEAMSLNSSVPVVLVSGGHGKWSCSDGVARDELELCPAAQSSWTLDQLMRRGDHELKYVPKDAEVDWRGHAPREGQANEMRMVLEAVGDRSEWKSVSFGDGTYCATCLNWYPLETNYVSVRAAFPCPGPPKERKYLLDVPSGEIVFLHSVYNYEHFKNPRGFLSNKGRSCSDVHSELVYEDWQANQAAFGIVPIRTSIRTWDGHNSDVVVSSTGTRVVVARASANLGWHEGYHIPEPHEVSLVDYRRFRTLKNRAGGRDADSPEEARLCVEPGLYEVTVSRRRSDPRSRGYWAVARRVGPPASPSPVYEPEVKFPMHPALWVAGLADDDPQHYFGTPPYPRTWGDSSPEVRYRAWTRAVSENLHLNGNVSYTNQRYWEAVGSSGDVSEAVPRFRERLHWYDDVDFDPSTMPPEMAELVARVLESLVSFGAHKDGVPEAALSHLRKLYEVHPRVADPAYVAWMSEPGRAEAWVASINARMATAHPELDIFRKMRV